MAYSLLLLTGALLFSLTGAGRSSPWTNGSTFTGTVPTDTVEDCTYWANNITTLDACQGILKYFKITQKEFTALNPSLKDDCSGMKIGNSYCVEARKPKTDPTPAWSTISYYPESTAEQPAATTSKTKTKTQKTQGQTSPTATSDKTETKTEKTQGQTSPTATPDETEDDTRKTQDGIAANCNKYHTVVQGDTCDKITKKYAGLSIQDFYKWNPDVGKDCMSLWAKYDVCIGVSSNSMRRRLSRRVRISRPVNATMHP